MIELAGDDGTVTCCTANYDGGQDDFHALIGPVSWRDGGQLFHVVRVSQKFASG